MNLEIGELDALGTEDGPFRVIKFNFGMMARFVDVMSSTDCHASIRNAYLRFISDTEPVKLWLKTLNV